MRFELTTWRSRLELSRVGCLTAGAAQVPLVCQFLYLVHEFHAQNEWEAP